MDWMELFNEDRADYEVFEDVGGKLHGIAKRIERLENACLIAAAPELLEACESMISSVGKTSAHNIQKCGLWPNVDAMNAAIAKAKGEA